MGRSFHESIARLMEDGFSYYDACRELGRRSAAARARKERADKARKARMMREAMALEAADRKLLRLLNREDW